MRLLLALLLVVVLGVSALYAQTDGFTVLTTEAARRISIEKQPRSLPETALNLAAGGQTRLRHVLQADGRVAIVNFIYTRCISVCLAMGSEFQQLQDAIRKNGLTGHVRLLSISFDPADTADQLARYARAMGADPQVWQFAGMPVESERRQLLDVFGIVTVPAPYGQYEHNAAYHVVTSAGLLTRIVDYGEPQSALQWAAAQGVGRLAAAPSALPGSVRRSLQ